MEVFLYNSTVCRLCGEENDNGTFLYALDENNQNTGDLVNSYLPIKVSDDGQLPRTICPGCTIQLEATVEFISLIVNGQKVLRSLHKRELEYKKTFLSTTDSENLATDNVVHEIDIEKGAYQTDHPTSLAVAGLDKPKRKRGRPPKKQKTPEELAQEAVAKEKEIQITKQELKDEEPSGKRKRKAPTRFQEVVQGKELEKIFIEEGVTDGESSEPEMKAEMGTLTPEPVSKVPEVIGHTESGELVVVVKGKGRGRPKGRLNQKCQKCAICEKEFHCSGRYMSHVAQHGPVVYQCTVCGGKYPTRLEFTAHQKETGHQGQIVLPKDDDAAQVEPVTVSSIGDPVSVPGALPDLSAAVVGDDGAGGAGKVDDDAAGDNNATSEEVTLEKEKQEPQQKVKLKCPHCDKLFSSKQSRSMHVKVVHKGERSYHCGECGASFAYPRALSLHALKHRTRASKGYACDLCGKVLNHPSSVTYHKEAEHAGQRYSCNKCGKQFKHRQLLQRHQLVHTQNRPFMCKVCNATFKTKANLFNHQLLHSGVKKYSCDLCKQKFAHKTSLTLHMRWHNGQKPYVCKVCGKAFSQKGNLSEHSRIHTGEKPFQCAHCPRRFTTSSQRRLHLSRHTKDKHTATPRAPAAAPAGAPSVGAYKCPLCARACSSRWGLAKHVRRHTGERPFQCPLCPRAFADCSNLNKHKKHVHKQNMSLLANQRPSVPLYIIRPEDSPEPQKFTVVEPAEEDERVIYVTYDVDEPNSTDYPLDDHQQAEELISQSEVLTGVMCPSGTHKEAQEHLSVTDEQGNPLHFTMQDGTQLAITSLDGQSLQVITQDGQTIPVEINGLAPDEVSSEDTIIHELSVEKTDEHSAASSPVTHYYTIV